MADLFRRYVPVPTLLQFHQDRDKYMYRFTRGVPASGKTVGCIEEILLWAIAQEPFEGVRRTRFAVVRATYPSLKSTTLRTWDYWIPGELFPVKQSVPFECKIKFTLPDATRVECEVLFLAVETEDDVKKLKSFELTGGYVNEVFEVSRSVVTTLFERTGRYPPKEQGGPTRRGVWGDTNSPSERHWYAKDELNPPKNWKFYVQPAPLIRQRNDEGETIGWERNPEAENIDNLAGGYRYYEDQVPGLKEDQLRVNIENKFGAIYAGRPVYDKEWSDDMVVPGGLHLNPGEKILIGIDTSGLNPAAVIGQTGMGSLALLDEILALDTPFEQFLTEALLPLLRVRYAGYAVLAIVDPSNPRDARTGFTPLQQLVLKGIPAVVAPTNNPKLRLDAVKHFMTRRQGLLVDPRCTLLREGFAGGYYYPQVKNSDGVFKEEPAKNDLAHLQEGLQYLALHLRRGDLAKGDPASDPIASRFRRGALRPAGYRVA